MFAEQRRRRIVEALAQQGSVRVAALSRKLGVTEETVRRDLDSLGRAGKLRRIHGGALALDEARRDLPFDMRQATHLPEKEAIGRAAASLVREGDVIALDASSTAYEMALALPDVSLTVLTPSTPIVVALALRSSLRVVSTGGQLDAPSMSFTGPLAEQALERFNVHKAFLSCKGLDRERGLSEASEAQASFKQRMIALADQTVALVDHSKLGVRSVVFFAGLDQVDVLVTDSQARAEELEALGRRVIRAGP